MEPLIDRVLGDRYQIRSLLGRQTGRRTFLARDLHTEQLVVLKLLLFGPDFTWDDLKLFEREAEVLKSIDLPSIPKYLDCFDVDTELGKGFVLVQTYIEAKSLQSWLDAGRTFSEEELISIAKQLLTILDYLHNRQPAVIHRDLKPSNILLGDRSGNHPGQVYLVDFGSVRTGANSSGTITIVGTYGYMPPEQFGGQTTAATDLYALGATIICLATGQHPSELPQKDLQIMFERQVSLQPQTIEWLKYLTEPSLEQRCQTTAQALFAIEQPSSRSHKLAGLVIKPTGSQVAVESTSNTLKIIIPKEEFLLVECLNRICFSMLLILLWLALATAIFAIPFVLTGGTHLEIFLLPLVVLVFYFIEASSLLTLSNTKIWLLSTFGQTEILLTDREISLNNRLFRNYQLLVAPIQNVSQIELVKDRYRDAGVQTGMVVIPDHLNIWAGTKRFGFGDKLSKPELEWLAQVCSEWLDLPISRDGTSIAARDLHQQN